MGADIPAPMHEMMAGSAVGLAQIVRTAVRRGMVEYRTPNDEIVLTINRVTATTGHINITMHLLQSILDRISAASGRAE